MGGISDAKVLGTLREALEAVGLRNGMTISFHHHLRNGDRVLNLTMQAIAEMGIGDLTVASSAFFPVHRPIIEHIRQGTVSGLTGGCNGPIGEAVSSGLLPQPVVFRSHGGRARALEEKSLKVDVSFIAAASADRYGNLSGLGGGSAFGSLGYAKVDALAAEKVIGVTDCLSSSPLKRVSIPGEKVDWIVTVDSIGEPSGIATGSLSGTRDPVRLEMARLAAEVAKACGVLRDGMSMQCGSGGATLAAAGFVGSIMKEKGVKGSFALGGVTSYLVGLLEQDLFDVIYDVQTFDAGSVSSLVKNENHVEISAAQYASMHRSAPLVAFLDLAFLSALEVDVHFNVKVITETDGVIRHGMGGHPDVAQGAQLTIVIAPLVRGRVPVVQERVTTVCTPGEHVDVLVTDHGIAVNPARPEIKEDLVHAGLPVVDIHDLKKRAEEVSGKLDPIRFTDRIVAIVEDPYGNITDKICQIEQDN